MKITSEEIKKITPGNPRAVQMTDPHQAESVSSLCCRLNRLNPNLPYKYGVRRQPENGVFLIVAIPKKVIYK